MIADPRNPRRCRQVRHLHQAGERVILELLLAVDSGVPLDEALAQLCSIPLDVYRVLDDNDLLSLPIDCLVIYDGQRPRGGR